MRRTIYSALDSSPVRWWATVVVALAIASSGCGGRSDYSVAADAVVSRGEGRANRRASSTSSRRRRSPERSSPGSRDGNAVTLVFGDGEKNAEELESAYHRFALPNVREGLSDVLRRNRNVVMRWHAHPEDADLATVEACLR